MFETKCNIVYFIIALLVSKLFSAMQKGMSLTTNKEKSYTYNVFYSNIMFMR